MFNHKPAMNQIKRFAIGSWLPCTEHKVFVLVHGRPTCRLPCTGYEVLSQVQGKIRQLRLNAGIEQMSLRPNAETAQ